MNDPEQSRRIATEKNRRFTSVSWLIGFGCVLIVLLGLLWPRLPKRTPGSNASMDQRRKATVSALPSPQTAHFQRLLRSHRPSHAEPGVTAQEIVAHKLTQFALSRRELMHELARRHGVTVPPSVERFFGAVESGNWDKIQKTFNAINGGDSSAGHTSRRSPDVEKLWPAIIDAYGVAEQVHLWPAQQLLDYGQHILDSLPPGSVYVGGTDNGRWIPELLNETSGGARHIVITQNGLADNSYLDYMQLQYGDQFATLSQEESKNIFQQYIADARKRLQHDQQFPNEPKQILPGENVTSTDGKIQVSGQVAVMAINEKLLQTLMQKNPDLSFAMEESYPLKNTYADAIPLGPIMELGAADTQNPFTAEQASQSVNYWQDTTQAVLADPQASGSQAAVRSYSHDANAAANLLAAHGFNSQAEQAYRLATQLCPYNPEPVGGLARVLAGTGHAGEATQLLNDFAQKYPDQRSAVEQIRQSISSTSPPASVSQ